MAKKIDKETKTLQEIIHYYEDFALRHNQLNDFKYGDIPDPESAKYLEYPAMWTFLQDSQLINNGRNGFNEIQLNFQILIMDEVDQDDTMIEEVQSDALTIANDLVAEWTYNRYYQDQFITVPEDINISPFREDLKSRVAGQRVELSIRVPFTNCYALDPVDDIPSYSARTITAKAQTIQESICGIVEDCALSFSKDITFEQDVDVLGAVSATTFYGDGSNLTGLKATFSGLTDTNLSGVTDGQIAIYDSSNNEWIPGNVETTFSGLTDTSFTGLTDGDVVVYNSGTTKWENSKLESSSYCNFYDSDMNGTGIPSGGIDVTLDSSQYNDTSIFTLNNPDVKVEKDGVYKIDYKLNTREGGRATSRGELHLDQGGGFSKVEGSLVYCYNRTSGNGYNTGTGSVVLKLNAGDRVKLIAYQNTGGGSTMANESTITISDHKGPVGPKGDKGDTGSISGTIFSGQFQMNGIDLGTVSGTTSVDLSNGNVFYLTVNNDITLDYSNANKTGNYLFVIEQDSNGGHTISYTGGKFQAPGGNAPELSQTPGAKTLITGTYDEVNNKMMVFGAKEINDI